MDKLMTCQPPLAKIFCHGFVIGPECWQKGFLRGETTDFCHRFVTWQNIAGAAFCHFATPPFRAVTWQMAKAAGSAKAKRETPYEKYPTQNTSVGGG